MALVVTLGGGVVLRGIGPIVTGHAARVGCGVVLLGDRPLDAVGDHLPDDAAMRLVDLSSDGDTVTATLLGGFDARMARDDAGGCRPLADGEDAPDPDVRPMVLRGDDLVVPTSPANEAANAGLDVPRLGAAVTAAFAEDVDPGTAIRTDAVVVVHQGTVVAERHGDGVDAGTPLPGWGVTTPVAATMAGALVTRGLLDVADPVPGRWDEDDPRGAITWDDLLAMTSGLSWDEGDGLVTDRTVSLFTDVGAGEYAADQPLAVDPGTAWRYSSGDTNIACDALVDVAGGDPSSTARRLVFEPLAMTTATLGTDGDAPVCSSFGWASARDWARLGLFHAQGGRWGGDRLVPEGWVEEVATRPVEAPVADAPAGATPGYARGWWLNRGPDGRRLPSVPADAYWALGTGGQQLVVVPSRDLVVVRLGYNEGVEDDWGLEPLVAGVVEAVDAAGGS